MQRGRKRRGRKGLTLIEVIVSSAIISILFVVLAAGLQSQGAATATTSNDARTFHAARAALNRILTELASAVRSPPGLTAAPTYAVSATSITFRRPIRYITTTDADYATAVAAGRVSANRILYDPYAIRIAYDPTARTVTYSRIAGTTPLPGFTQVLCSNVTSFAFYEGENLSATPPAPTNGSFIIGVRLTVSATSDLVTDVGGSVTSNLGFVELNGKSRVLFETLTVDPGGAPQVTPP
jgi:prepilin-type N-terminal cleavage/methylation domain-containing protein